jgi:hypothetical protein
LDHGALIKPATSHRDYTVELNAIVREVRMWALQFNRGEGVPILLLWQINRTGKDAADKADGVYTMSAISYANEVEKSADVITTTYLNDDYKRQNRVKFANMKNRDNPTFEPFIAATALKSRLVCNRSRFEGGNGMAVSLQGEGTTYDV